MTQRRRAYEIFKRSAEIPETEVEDFLVQACAKDLELRKQVEKLLSLENDAEVFLPEGPSRAPTNLAELRPAEDPQTNSMIVAFSVPNLEKPISW